VPNFIEKYYFLPKLLNAEFRYQNKPVTNMALHHLLAIKVSNFSKI